MVQPDPEQLAEVPLFAGLSSDQLVRLATHFEMEEFAAGQSPARTGRHGYAFYILAEGAAHAELDGRLLEQLEPGSVFGEMAFFDPSSRRTATVVPDTAITVYTMFGTRFREMQSELPEVAQRLQDLFEVRNARTEPDDAGPA